MTKLRTKALMMAVIFFSTYMLATLLYFKPVSTYASSTGTVTGSSVNVRTGAGTGYEKITQLNTGAKVTILDTVKTSDTYAWYHIGFYLNSTYTTGYITSQYVSVDATYENDTDFETWLTNQGFPDSYKPYLRTLHAKYPNWVFYADKIKYSWDEVVAAENSNNRSLIGSSSITSWKSLDTTAYNWETGTWYGQDGSSWVTASEALIKYALDPRNFLDLAHIFMFENISYNGDVQTESGVSSIVSGTFMSGTSIENGQTYYSALMQAGQESGVSPYHLAARIIQEIGVSGSSGSISGNYEGITGVYNYYNIGAYAGDGKTAITNGLLYAYKLGWTSRISSIVGGAKFIGNNYVNRGQNTLYYEKFDFITPYNHQYMTNILAHKSESTKVVNAYSSDTLANNKYEFKIPVYSNMPSTACASPTGDGDPNNVLKELGVDGCSLTPTYTYFTTSYDVIVGADVNAVTISASAVSSSAKISGTGTHSLNSGMTSINVTVTSESGVARTYTINVSKSGASTGGSSGGSTGSSSGGSTGGSSGGSTGDSSGGSTGGSSGGSTGGSSAGSTGGSSGGSTGGSSGGSTGGSSGGSSGGTGINSTGYKLDTSSKTLSSVGVGSQATDILGNVSVTSGYSSRVVDTSGNEKSGTVGTGDRVIVTDGSGNVVSDYTVVIYGDVDGDGQITSLDLLYVKRDVLDIRNLSGAYAVAAKASRGTDSVSSVDLVYIKRDILGIKSIVQ